MRRAPLPFSQRQEVVVYTLDHVGLAAQQRVDLRLRVGDPCPLDAVNLRSLAAGEPRRWLWMIASNIGANFLSATNLLRPPSVASSPANQTRARPKRINTIPRICKLRRAGHSWAVVGSHRIPIHWIEPPIADLNRLGHMHDFKQVEPYGGWSGIGTRCGRLMSLGGRWIGTPAVGSFLSTSTAGF